MKILAIGRNYAAHASEMGNAVPDKPMVFMKPKSALLLNNEPFYYPSFSDRIEFETELVIRISREAKNVTAEAAQDFFEEIAIGIDFTARDLQAECKQKGHPWEIAKGFDQAAPLSHFIPISKLPNPNSIRFNLLKNGETIQRGDSSNMIFDFQHLIAYCSRFFTLNPGDLIYTGTPEGVGPVEPGDKLEAFLENEKMLTCEIKSAKQ